MIRAVYGTTAMISVITGRTSSFGYCQGLDPGSVTITLGRRWRTVVEKITASVMPTTNSGSATSPRVAIEVVWSNALSRLRALIAPSAAPHGGLAAPAV